MSQRHKKSRSRSPEPTWRERVATAVEMIVATSKTPLYHMKVTVIQAARDAIDLEKPSDGMFLDCPPKLLKPGVSDDKLLSMAGIFRLILVNDVPDWRTPMAAETFMAEVQRALDGELAKLNLTY